MISQPASIVRRLLLVVFFAAAISACSSQQPLSSSAPGASGSSSRPTVNAAADAVGHRVAAVAMDQLGVPYRYGGNAPSGFDCSGLVHYSYARVGKSVPRTTSALWNAADPVVGSNMRIGDLLFFNIAGKMSHVGMYVGDGRFVHAPSSGKVVSIGDLRSDYYSRAFIRAGRLK